MATSATDKAKEKIKYYVEIIKLMTVILAGTMGGVIAFIVGSPTPKQVVFTAFGMLFSASLIHGIIALDRTIKRLIDDL